MHSTRYRTYASYLMQEYGEKVYKIPVHLPASCPNRDGSLGLGGCDFCGLEGAGFEMLPSQVPVEEQLEQNISYMGKKVHAKKFIAYFQNFSNTYLPMSQFRDAMEKSLRPDVAAFAISTRPDCIEEEHLVFLKDLSEKNGIGITFELGLQTANYHTLYAINRGHGLAAFIDAVQRIHQMGFQVCAHVILNLPGDTEVDSVETARILSALQVEQVKLHALYLMKNTRMGEAYEKGEIQMITVEEYIDRVILFLENLRPETVVQRLIGRAPETGSLFVNWGMSWWKIRDAIHEKMLNEDRSQGSKWGR